MSIPDRFGRYAVRRRLGAGAFATVYLAYDAQLDSPVAVKVLAENWAGDLHVRERFVAEGRLLRKVDSPHVVTVHDAGELPDGRPFLVMTYADSGTLVDQIEAGAPASVAEAVEIVRQVGLGLTALHHLGIVHRDIKPANVLFRTAPDEVRAVVGDLGLGKVMDASSRLTMITGTPAYAAPEQARGERVTEATDQYALAAVACLLLEGRPPFAHSSLIDAQRPEPLPPLMVGPEVDAVVRRGLAPDPTQRWPSVAAFTRALAAAAPDIAEGERGQLLAPVPDRTQLHQASPRVGARGWADQPADAVMAPTSVDRSDPDPTRDRSPGVGSGGPGFAEPGTRGAPGGRAVRGVVGLLVAAAAVAAGFFGVQALGEPEATYLTIRDNSGEISVEVPAAWAVEVASDGWTPPGAARSEPAISIGSDGSWRKRTSSAPGVFAAFLLGNDVPDDMPRHRECAKEQATTVPDEKTLIFTGCPGGVIVERVTQVDPERLLWVQVRAESKATAEAVLASVKLRGSERS